MVLLVAITRTLWGARPTGPTSATWAGVVAAELGLVGLVLLAVLLVAIACLLWRARATGRPGATWAGAAAAAAAFATHSGFDFVWHLPAIVLTVTLLIGLVLPAPDTGSCPAVIHPRPRRGTR